MTCWIPFCFDCTALLCECGECHTFHCDNEQLCKKKKRYIKGYGVLIDEKSIPSTDKEIKSIPPRKGWTYTKWNKLK